ncbi:MAG TPA: long polar fimbrial protein LpfD [Salmonella bongori]|uniref:Long polar fimbrial protein LpfD n=5 Tax=Salmonella TaxID=590 RepID=A0A750KM74_SALER|nr:long polar fimbrial protein LpfD [Salmonella bongori]AGR60902.1 Putative fimbrial protein [Salmonella bongori N268-08]ASG52949.1 long polar fimbrial protein LpfD [Salmonella bongori serovar 66:z41:- str. SA19983605]ECC9753041.1 long polar fimbrial protein LpfD [Salmonella bongori]ECE6549157.1 long polar fimbrial protein LpfD [Salmonella bongori]ECI3517067.1 long polar fimbrial protein LpfD [Salmonella bongori]
MLKKLMTFAGLMGGSVLFSGQAAAADWGPCEAVGGTKVYSPSFDQTISDPSKNESGSIIENFYSWDVGGSYKGTCECPAVADRKEPYPPEYYKATSDLPLANVVGGYQYFQINSHLAFSGAITIYHNGLVPIPFTDLSNKSANGTTDCEPGNYITGSTGTINLQITHPFVGEQVIPSTKLLDLFGTKKPGVYGTTALASVYISGRVVVPQGCELSNGSTIEIPFGDFKASDFKDRKGQIAKNATKFTKELQFKCTNISDGVKIFLRIEGMPNANDSNAIDMGNPDIGAVIEGDNGNILVPNDTSVNQELDVSGLVDGTHRTASTTISAYPISTTGKLPTAGKFEGIATMSIDVE